MDGSHCQVNALHYKIYYFFCCFLVTLRILPPYTQYFRSISYTKSSLHIYLTIDNFANF